MKDVLISAPYMLPFMQRFTPVLTRLGMRVIIPDVHERLSEEELLRYAGQFDGTICGDAAGDPGLPSAPESYFQMGHRY